MFYSREKLELMANEINRKYYPKRLDSILPLDPYDLLEKQGLDVEWKYISPNDKLLGMIFFEDGAFPVWDKRTYKKGDKPHYEFFKKGTIVINSFLTESKKFKEKENAYEEYICSGPVCGLYPFCFMFSD